MYSNGCGSVDVTSVVSSVVVVVAVNWKGNFVSIAVVMNRWNKREGITALLRHLTSCSIQHAMKVMKKFYESKILTKTKLFSLLESSLQLYLLSFVSWWI